jgi:hypothetical protein
MRITLWILSLTLTSPWACGQVLKTRPAEPPNSPAITPQTLEAPLLPLTIPAGTPIKVALDRELRVRSVGQPVHGKVTEPVYAFDHLVVPAGSEVLGKISAIEHTSAKTRVLSAMNANFSPSRKVQVSFGEIVLPDGKKVPMETSVSPASGGVLEFVPAGSEVKPGKVGQGRALVSREISSARNQVKDEWNLAKEQLKQPGKGHELERYAVAQLPYHPQYVEKGAAFNADLKQPLQFGSEQLNLEKLSAIGTQPPAGSVVHAYLMTPLSSATTQKGDPVEAVVTQPLVISGKLFVPEGSRLKGAVLQVRPAGRLSRNGQLRIVFHELIPPNGVRQRLEGSLQGVQVADGRHLALDSEGGAQVTTPRTRYLTTAISVALAASTATDRDAGKLHGAGDGGTGRGALNGASGFKLIGTLTGVLARSRAVSSGLGFYGAALSVYSHFLARGRDVIYPKDMAMMVGFGTRENTSPKPEVHGGQ